MCLRKTFFSLLTIKVPLLAITGQLAVLLAAEGLPQPEKIDYNRDIRPILSENCFRCHGSDEKARKAELRLDVREEAVAKQAIAPGDLARSQLWERITSTDPEEVMPPPEAHRQLTERDKDTLRRWIEQGADYQPHWSLITPVRPAVPSVVGAEKEPIDAFVRKKLSERNLQPAAPATKLEWLRRVTLDLTGLPPSVAEQEAFSADQAEGAEERVVDRLLASPAYGERMAADWLDVARYADTYGRHEDADCRTWPYRDWVIKAFNENLPYDQFILWQTAGDLLPNPTRDQLIATCFNRLTLQSNEAGSNPEEFRIEQVADRVRTNGLAWLGLSVECARCHDHKYDPISMKDYYSLAAFFNNIDELGLFCVFTGGTPTPSMLLYTPEQEEKNKAALAKIAALEAQGPIIKSEAQARFASWQQQQRPPVIDPVPTRWEKFTSIFKKDPLPRADKTLPVVFYKFESLKKKETVDEIDPMRKAMLRVAKAELVNAKIGKGLLVTGDTTVHMTGIREYHRMEPFSFGLWLKPKQSYERAVVAHHSRSGLDAASRGIELIIDHDRLSFALCHFSPGNEIRIRTRQKLTIDQWAQVTVTYDGSSRADGMRIYLDGQRAEVEVVRDHLYRDIVYRTDWGDDTGKDQGSLGFVLAGRHNDAGFKDGLIDEFFFYDRELTEPEVRQWYSGTENSSPGEWFDWYLREKDEPYQKWLAELKAARAEQNELSGQALDLMIMKEFSGARRPTHVLDRGQFDQPTTPVEPDTPPSVMAYKDELPKNRLGFAQWLIDPAHPLTSRVAVNRLWQQFFGRGLVATAEDFGTQGQLPSHPELLDWLAVEFRESGWNVKAFCRRLVLSQTYRQSGQPRDPAQLRDDPDNQWLTRGPRRRLSAEAIRDLALASSGLLVPTIGGPSVKPYQPAGLWEEAGTQHVYHQDTGDKLYRRSLYTFWRRTMPPPSMLVFDAPTREYCQPRRVRTSTPLQSLVLMNDPQIIEAARYLAEHLVRTYPQDDRARVREAFCRLVSVPPNATQEKTLMKALSDERQNFTTDPAAATELLTKNGQKPHDSSLSPVEVASTALMLRLLFGFNETTMKP